MLASFRSILFRSVRENTLSPFPFYVRSIHSLTPSFAPHSSSPSLADTSIFDEAFEELKKLEEKEEVKVDKEKKKKKETKKATAVNAQCESSFKKMNIVGSFLASKVHFDVCL